MKEFVVYTALRLLLFVASLAIVSGIWSLVSGGTVSPIGVLVLALLISGVASYFVLNRQRDAFAKRVEARAGRMADSFEARKAREDDESDGPAAPVN